MTIEQIVAALQAIVDGAEGRDLTDEEATRYEELEGQLTAARRTAEIRSRQEAYTTPVSGGLQVNLQHATQGEDTLERAFEHYLRTGQENNDLVELRAQSKGTDSAGGYTVPDGFRQKIVERLKEFGGFMNEAESLTTDSGNAMEYPTNDDTSNSAEIVAENGAAASAGADLVFGTVNLGAFKYEATGTGNVPLKVSWELLQDSAFDIQGYVARKLAERLHRKLSVDLITGTGSGQPQGVIAAKTAYDEIASNSAGPTYAELVATYHAVDPAYRSNAKWLMNDATLAVLQSMVDDNGRPLWTPANGAGMVNLEEGTLLGKPVVIDQAVPSIGDQAKFLAFGDYREAYVVRHVKDITLVVLNELYAVNGQVGFLSWMRADGRVQNTNAYAVLAGENTA